MTGLVSALLLVSLCMQVIVLFSMIEKKMVFDLIPKMISKTAGEKGDKFPTQEDLKKFMESV